MAHLEVCEGENSPEDSPFLELLEIDPEPPIKRVVCERCRRPITVCWCPFLSNPPPDLKTNTVILQHPFEESRTLRTAPMLEQGLPNGKCHILRGKRFHLHKYPFLEEIVDSPQTLLLYPGPNAVDLKEIAESGNSEQYTLILLDGTWAQAKGMYAHNKFLHTIKQVQLTNTPRSEYVIRTQPTDGCLSTLETAAISISMLEHNPDLADALIKPLKALCRFQLDHGAVPHQSRQHLIDNGLYTKQLPKSVQKKCEQKKNIKEPPPPSSNEK